VIHDCRTTSRQLVVVRGGRHSGLRALSRSAQVD
jgi:hypothetical protein